MLSQIIEATENNTDVQTNEVLTEVATYLNLLAEFVNESNVIINRTVSSTAWLAINHGKIYILYIYIFVINFAQIIVDVVHVVNSFLQWEPENIMVASSSR